MKKYLCLLWLSLSAPLSAHPHVWIDIEVTPQIGESGNITAIHEKWVFDPLYAHMLLESVLREPDENVQKQLLQHVQQDIVQKLRAEHYYTFPAAEFDVPRNGKLLDDRQQLVAEVDIPLAKPTHELRYQLYEPGYFVEVLHSKDQPETFANGCTLTVIPPTPNPEKAAAAAALDRNQQGEANLGRYFAETGVIRCP